MISAMKKTVSVGVADSGINPVHRQVGSVAGGVGIRYRDGQVELDTEWKDMLGHGTSAAATVRGHAPDAELYSIRIFRRRLEAHVEALLGAMDWACSNGLDLLNLSLGCTERAREADFAEACTRASRAGLLIVAAAEVSGEASLPGLLDDVIAVRADRGLETDELRFENGVFVASTWARPLGELPKERNFYGVSLAIAHVTGMAAALLASGVRKEDVRSRLAERSG